MEVINLDESNPSLTCPNLRDFPLHLSGGIGQLYRGVPVVCGGEDGEGEASCECHQLQNGNWIRTAPLSECRLWATSATFTTTSGEQIMLVTGGTNVKNNPLKSVESYNGHFWNQLDYVDLPMQSFDHCSVRINDSLLLVIGGLRVNYYASASAKTYFFNVHSNKWNPGPSITKPRSRHACGAMDWLNPDTNVTKKYVVVAGGNDRQALFTNSVEILIFDDYLVNKLGWQPGPNLPRALSRGRMAEYNNSVFHLGGWEEGRKGNGTYIYKLSNPGGPWVLMAQKLKVLRDTFVTFLIPDEFAYCF